MVLVIKVVSQRAHPEMMTNDVDRIIHTLGETLVHHATRDRRPWRHHGIIIWANAYIVVIVDDDDSGLAAAGTARFI